MILTDDNFATIVAAIEEGRAIFSNVHKFIRYLLSSNVGEIATMFFGVLLAGVIGLRSSVGEGLVVPLLATQILWTNLLTDAAPALAVGVDPPDERVMERPPRVRSDRLIDAQMWTGIRNHPFRPTSPSRGKPRPHCQTWKQALLPATGPCLSVRIHQLEQVSCETSPTPLGMWI